ncbi:MAG: cell envelope integrity protein TolA [Coxiellaceae bacterium]|nr:cell envelope integrity protein TolA [Coxiellaceae bacterium]
MKQVFGLWASAVLLIQRGMSFEIDQQPQAHLNLLQHNVLGLQQQEGRPLYTFEFDTDQLQDVDILKIETIKTINQLSTEYHYDSHEVFGRMLSLLQYCQQRGVHFDEAALTRFAVKAIEQTGHNELADLFLFYQVIDYLASEMGLSLAVLVPGRNFIDTPLAAVVLQCHQLQYPNYESMDAFPLEQPTIRVLLNAFAMTGNGILMQDDSSRWMELFEYHKKYMQPIADLKAHQQVFNLMDKALNQNKNKHYNQLLRFGLPLWVERVSKIPEDAGVLAYILEKMQTTHIDDETIAKIFIAFDGYQRVEHMQASVTQFIRFAVKKINDVLRDMRIMPALDSIDVFAIQDNHKRSLGQKIVKTVLDDKSFVLTDRAVRYVELFAQYYHHDAKKMAALPARIINKTSYFKPNKLTKQLLAVILLTPAYQNKTTLQKLHLYLNSMKKVNRSLRGVDGRTTYDTQVLLKNQALHLEELGALLNFAPENVSSDDVLAILQKSLTVPNPFFLPAFYGVTDKWNKIQIQALFAKALAMVDQVDHQKQGGNGRTILFQLATYELRRRYSEWAYEYLLEHYGHDWSKSIHFSENEKYILQGTPEKISWDTLEPKRHDALLVLQDVNSRKPVSNISISLTTMILGSLTLFFATLTLLHRLMGWHKLPVVEHELVLETLDQLIEQRKQQEDVPEIKAEELARRQARSLARKEQQAKDMARLEVMRKAREKQRKAKALAEQKAKAEAATREAKIQQEIEAANRAAHYKHVLNPVVATVAKPKLRRRNRKPSSVKIATTRLAVTSTAKPAKTTANGKTMKANKTLEQLEAIRLTPYIKPKETKSVQRREGRKYNPAQTAFGGKQSQASYTLRQTFDDMALRIDNVVRWYRSLDEASANQQQQFGAAMRYGFIRLCEITLKVGHNEKLSSLRHFLVHDIKPNDIDRLQQLHVDCCNQKQLVGLKKLHNYANQLPDQFVLQQRVAFRVDYRNTEPEVFIRQHIQHIKQALVGLKALLPRLEKMAIMTAVEVDPAAIMSARGFLFIIGESLNQLRDMPQRLGAADCYARLIEIFNDSFNQDNFTCLHRIRNRVAHTVRPVTTDRFAVVDLIPPQIVYKFVLNASAAVRLVYQRLGNTAVDENNEEAKDGEESVVGGFKRI